jgi:hypothetical protein
MNPQHSSPARAVSRCRDTLHSKSCSKYIFMHPNTFIKYSTEHHILSGERSPTYNVPRCGISDRTRNTSLVFSAPNEPWVNAIGCAQRSCNSGYPQQISLNDKHIKFNRMNGSPGDPPANRMHKFKSKRITPFNHRLASDPTGKEASWETTT